MYDSRATFEFDPKKAAANLRKQGVSFAEVEQALYDPRALTREDANVVEEKCFLAVGTGAFGRGMAVCWTEHGLAIRLISARLATGH